MSMRYPYLQVARTKLRERVNSCMQANYRTGSQEVERLVRYLESNPVTGTILNELRQIKDRKFQDIGEWIDSYQNRIKFPHNEDEHAALYFRFMLYYTSDEKEVPGFSSLFGLGSTDLQSRADAFMREIILPFATYIESRIKDGDFLLYILCRYQRECGWFRRNELDTIACDSDHRKLEAVLDADIRRWLFSQGYDYPFSTPRSPSGESDVVVLDGEKPIPLEVKVYDGYQRGVKHIQQGIWQAYRYAQDYSSPFGYLIVFNRTQSPITLDGNIGSDHPPCVSVGDRIVFVVVVAATSRETSASKEKTIAPVAIPVGDPKGS